MPQTYTSDHEDFRASVRTFIEREVTPHSDTFIKARGFPRDLWLAAGEQGLLGIAVPERFGGSAIEDYRYQAVLISELAASNLALASSLSVHFDVVAPYLITLTDSDQQERWLPGFVSGELITAIAMTEPSGGSDLAALRTTAQRDGDDWILNGAKTFITNGVSADLIVVAARTTPNTGAKGITLFVVEGDAPGLTRGAKLDKVGQPEADTSELFFDQVRVRSTDVLGEVDLGFRYMMAGLPQERLGAAVANLSHARQIFIETLEYVRTRVAFGSPIGSFQHNKFLLADLTTRLDVTQAYIDQLVLAHADHHLAPHEAAQAKWWTAQLQNEVIDHCLQLHGGYGYMNEQRVARAWRDARVTKIWAGSNEIMKEVVGRHLGL